MKNRSNWQGIALLVPKAWLPLIDQAKGDMPRTHWIRELIRDALKVNAAWPEKEEPTSYTLKVVKDLRRSYRKIPNPHR